LNGATYVFTMKSMSYRAAQIVPLRRYLEAVLYNGSITLHYNDMLRLKYPVSIWLNAL